MILLTAFEPFGCDVINSSWEVASTMLADYKGNADIALVKIPVSFKRAPLVLAGAIEKLSPDVVLMLGQGKGDIRLERVALNIMDSSKGDNDGYKPQDETVVVGGDLAYSSRLPLRKLHAALTEANIPVNLSNTAGLYVCNTLFYNFLHYNKSLPGGFVHLPYLKEQQLPGADRTTLPLETMKKAVRIIIDCICAEYKTI